MAQLGIGTTSPTEALDVENNDATKMAIDLNNTSSGDPAINLQVDGTTTFSIGIDNSDGDKSKIGTSDVATSTALTGDVANERITIIRAGKYLVTGKTTSNGIAGGRVRMQVYKNGALEFTEEGWTNTTAHYDAQESKILDLAVGDYLELYTRQTTGSSQDTETSEDQRCFLSVKEIR